MNSNFSINKDATATANGYWSQFQLGTKAWPEKEIDWTRLFPWTQSIIRNKHRFSSEESTHWDGLNELATQSLLLLGRDRCGVCWSWFRISQFLTNKLLSWVGSSLVWMKAWPEISIPSCVWCCWGSLKVSISLSVWVDLRGDKIPHRLGGGFNGSWIRTSTKQISGGRKE